MATQDNLVVNPQFRTGDDINQHFVTDLDDDIPNAPLPDPISINDGPLGDSIPNELPNYHAELEIVSNNQSKILSIQQVEKTILGLETVSKKDAIAIESIIETPLPINVNSYSEAPSRVNLDETKKYLSNEIKSHTKQLHTVLKDLCTNKLLQSINDIEAEVIGDDSNLEKLLNTVISYELSHTDIIKELLVSKNTVINVDNKFYNILELSNGRIENFCRDSVEGRLSLDDKVKELLYKLNILDIIVKRESLSRVLYVYSDDSGKGYEAIFNNEYLPSPYCEVNAILRSFANGTYSKILSEFKAYLVNNSNQYSIVNLKTFVSTVEGENVNALDWVNENALALETNLTAIHRIGAFLLTYKYFIKAGIEFIDALSEFALNKK